MQSQVQQMNVEPERPERVSWRQRVEQLPLSIKVTAVVAACLLLMGGVVAGICWPQGHSANETNADVEIMTELSNFYEKNINKSLEPCDNFYAYTCSNLIKKYKEEEKDSFNTMASMKKKVRISLDKSLQEPMNTHDTSTLANLKRFYKSCINETKVEAEGVKPIVELLEKIGGWPLQTNDLKLDVRNRAWIEIVGNVNKVGFLLLFPFYLRLHADPNNPTNTVMLLTPLLHVKKPILINEVRTIEFLKSIAYSLGGNNSNIDDDLKDCIDFEYALYQTTKSANMAPDICTMETLKNKYPEMPWDQLFSNAFISSQIKIATNETILLSHPEYNQEVSRLLKQTSTSIVQNYIVWRLILEAIPILPERFREAKRIFKEYADVRSRNLDCVDILINKAKVAVGHFYIKNFFDKSVKSVAQNMFDRIKNEAHTYLSGIKWIDNDTSSNIIDTLKKLRVIIAYSDDDINIMENFSYESNDTNFANYLRLVKSHRDLKLSRLRLSQEVDHQFIPYEYATDANAYYFSSTNATFILAAMFQKPFFAVNQPMYLNYGGIGFSMAHEITHGLKILSACKNETCRSYDPFQNRTKCVEEAYNNYTMDQVQEKVMGNRTLEENLGDLMGLKFAYHSYDKYAREFKADEKLLPGLAYTTRQMFWINAVMGQCTHQTDAALKRIILSDDHSPAEARINVAFAHSDDFSRDFACEIGSKMNPVDKCRFENDF